MEFLETLKETRKTYAEMVKFCTNDLIFNNVIVDELERNGFISMIIAVVDFITPMKTGMK